MVQNIILRDLDTPEPTIKATSSPIISTKVGQRDGTRSGGGGSGGGGGGGTSNGLFDINNLDYLGAFALADPGGEGKISFGYGSIAFNPPNGSNGPLGSVFLSGRTKDGSPHPSDNANIAEWQIPETLETSLLVTTADSLPLATPLQPFVRVELTSAGNDGTNTLTDFSNNMCGFMCVADGKLFTYFTPGYEQGYGSDDPPVPRLNTLCVFNNPSDLSQGGIPFGNLSAHRATAHSWMIPIPPERQSVLGGTHLFGSGGSRASFDSVSSWGPSLHVGTPEGYAGGELAVTAKLNYPSNLSIARSIPRPADWKGVDQPSFDAYNQTALIHYLQALGGDTTITEYLTPPSGNPCFLAYREWLESPIPTPWNTLPPPPGPLNDLWLLAFSTAACGFIIPGTNTYLVIGTMGGAKYGGGYKFAQWGGSWVEAAGPATVDPNDVQPTFYWAFNLDDILSASNVYDPFPYAYGEIPNKPPLWSRPMGSRLEPAPLCGGTVDYENKRYYQTRFEVKKGSFSKVNVVEVYSFA